MVFHHGLISTLAICYHHSFHLRKFRKMPVPCFEGKRGEGSSLKDFEGRRLQNVVFAGVLWEIAEGSNHQYHR